jgi:hypothetical protein
LGNDLIIIGEPQDVLQIEQYLDKEGEMMEYFGSKIDIVFDNTGLGTAKFSQPVLVQKLATEFEMDLGTGTTP